MLSVAMQGQAVVYATRPAVLDAPSLHRAIHEDDAGLQPLDAALSQLDADHACAVAPDEPFELDRRGGLSPSLLVCDLLRRGGLAVKRYDAGEIGSLVVVALIDPCTWTEGTAAGAGALGAAAAAPVCCNAEHFRAAAAGGAAPRWNALQPVQPVPPGDTAAATPGCACPMCGFQVPESCALTQP